jgi:spore coat protein E
MSNYKEIVTKAVVGKAKKTSSSTFEITPDNTPNTILGCWVINHKFEGYSSSDNININGSFDVNVWYSYENDSKTNVSTKNFTYTDTLKVHLKETVNDGKEVLVHSLKQPTVTDVKIENGIVKLTIEKELGVEVVGNTKIKVPVEDEMDDYEDLTEEIKSEEAIDKVNDNYLK